MGCARHVVFAAVACCGLAVRPGARADDAVDAVAVLRAVGPEGAGNAAAAFAGKDGQEIRWKRFDTDDATAWSTSTRPTRARTTA